MTSSIFWRLFLLTFFFLFQTELCNWCQTAQYDNPDSRFLFGGEIRLYTLAVTIGAFSLLLIRTTWVLRLAAIAGALQFALAFSDNKFEHTIYVALVGALIALGIYVGVSAIKADATNSTFDFGYFLGRILVNKQRGRAWGRLPWDVAFAVGIGVTVLAMLSPQLNADRTMIAALTLGAFVLTAPVRGRGIVAVLVLEKLALLTYASVALGSRAIAATAVLFWQLSTEYAPPRLARFARNARAQLTSLVHEYGLGNKKLIPIMAR